MSEIWKDIIDYEGLYQVSNLGRIKSLKFGKEKILKFGKSKGYLNVNLYNFSKKNIKVHQLVAMSFLRHKLCGMKLVIDHINDNKSDNRLENLQIVTPRFNAFKTQGNYSSKYKGVCYHKKAEKWSSSIRINKKLIYLGLFKTEEEASNAYQNNLNLLKNR